MFDEGGELGAFAEFEEEEVDGNGDDDDDDDDDKGCGWGERGTVDEITKDTYLIDRS